MESMQLSSGMRGGERGATLIMVALSLAVLLGISALAIDLAAFYVARNEAQRAADAAALAGAKVFVETSCISLGTCSNSTLQGQATQRAETVGAQNTVFGQAANIQNSDVTFPPAPPQNPLITVTVQRTTARGNAVPTFFAKILGKRTVDISAVATAEAYNPSGTSSPPTFCTSCVRPWYVPNCDPNSTSPVNSKCAPASNGNNTPAYFIDPNNKNAIANAKCVTQGGPIGEYFPIKVNTVPSQYGAVDFGGGANGYRTAIQTCNTGQFTCGDTFFPVKTGNMVGPTKQGVETLLNISGTGLNKGQDTIDTSVCPVQIHAGSQNPLVLNAGLPVGSVIPMEASSSVVTVIVYDGTQLSPGKGFNTAIPIVGFMQVFLTQVSDGSKGQLCGNTQLADSDACGVVLNIVGCGTTGGNCTGTGTVSGGGGSLIPIRLVRNPGA
jgi:hypothetical protein